MEVAWPESCTERFLKPAMAFVSSGSPATANHENDACVIFLLAYK